MLFTLLLALATTAAVVGVVVCFAYPRSCKDLENHLGTVQPSTSEDKDGAYAWRDKRWALDRIRTRVATVGLAAYAVGMLSLIPVMQHGGREQPSLFSYVLMAACTAAILMVGVRSTIHNGREFELDLDRRYPGIRR